MNQATKKSEPPSRISDLLASIKDVSERIPLPLKESASQARAEKIDLDGKEQFFKLRWRWSFCIIVWISLILLFQASLTIEVGRGVLDFHQYQWFLPVVIGQSFLQIIGMGFVVVKFLYAEPR